jgi:GNAT superfamily N-acetyltransferase
MTTIAVNPVASDDIQALVTSVTGLFREDAGQHDTTVNIDWPTSEGAAYYSGLVDDPDSLMLLARDGEQVVGHLVGKLNGPSDIRIECIAVLESMRVAPGSRRMGVGSLLIQRFFDWARDVGARQASVTAYAANDTALRLYARHGFVPQSVISRVVL